MNRRSSYTFKALIFTSFLVSSPMLESIDFPVYSDVEVDSNIPNDEKLNESEAPEKVFQVIIDPKNKTLLSAEIQSPVVKISKHMGDQFSKGDVLIQLDDTVYQSNLKKAKAVLERARVELEGKRQLYNDNVASLFELKEAEANVAIAEAELAIAQRDLKATTITAPYDGKVVDLKIEEWELPQPGKELIEIVYNKKLLAKLLVPSSLLPEIEVGKPFTIKLAEVDKKITAKILRIGSVIDPSSSTVKIEAEIDNESGELLPGMTGSVVFEEGKEPSQSTDKMKVNNIPPQR